jgi:hypothetical protein
MRIAWGFMQCKGRALFSAMVRHAPDLSPLASPWLAFDGQGLG